MSVKPWEKWFNPSSINPFAFVLAPFRRGKKRNNNNKNYKRKTCVNHMCVLLFIFQRISIRIVFCLFVCFLNHSCGISTYWVLLNCESLLHVNFISLFLSFTRHPHFSLRNGIKKYLTDSKNMNHRLSCRLLPSSKFSCFPHPSIVASPIQV